MRLTKCYVWSTLLYAAETWTITETLIKKIDFITFYKTKLDVL